MKKALSMLLCVTMAALCLVGSSCGNSDNTDPQNPTDDSKEVVLAKVVGIQLTEEEYAFGVDKDQPELLEKVNEYIEKIMDDGTFAKISEKYFGSGTPEAVKSAQFDESKDQLVVATNAEFEPFEYMEGEDFYGIDMEIAKGLADFLGKELVINHMDFDAVCLAVGQHKCDVAMAGLTVSPDREEYVTFSNSYYNASQVLITKSTDTDFDNCQSADDVIAKLLEKSGAKIGVQTGTTGQYFIEGDEDWGFDGLEGIECKGYKNSALAVMDMLNGNIDYVMADEAPANAIVKGINATR